MKGLLSDHNVEGQVQVLLRLLQEDYRLDFWTYLNLTVPTFHELGLAPESSDWIVWQKSQEHELILLTANRNNKDSQSLESTIRALNKPHSLPVITLADADRLLEDKAYAKRTADKLLEYLVEIERYRGTGRLYIP